MPYMAFCAFVTYLFFASHCNGAHKAFSMRVFYRGVARRTLPLLLPLFINSYHPSARLHDDLDSSNLLVCCHNAAKQVVVRISASLTSLWYVILPSYLKWLPHWLCLPFTRLSSSTLAVAPPLTDILACQRLHCLLPPVPIPPSLPPAAPWPAGLFCLLVLGMATRLPASMHAVLPPPSYLSVCLLFYTIQTQRRRHCRAHIRR